MDNQQLICLYMLSQLLERELVKCLRLVEAIPMDMSSFNGESVTFDLGDILPQGHLALETFDINKHLISIDI